MGRDRHKAQCLYTTLTNLRDITTDRIREVKILSKERHGDMKISPQKPSSGSVYVNVPDVNLTVGDVLYQL